MAAIYFITGTDTGVGKTVLTALLARHLREQGTNTLAVKPFCSGGREDAQLLRLAQNEEVTLDEINPWHFRAPLAPLLAARREHRVVRQAEVLRFLRTSAGSCEMLLVEGAGGLLSPLGEGFDARALILELKATPIVVCPNRLGAVNQVRLVLAAFPKAFANAARVVLMETSRPNQATRTNVGLLSEYLSPNRLITIPRLDWPAILVRPKLPASLVRALRRLGVRTDRQG
jgi:dethiobiotin synthetase